MSRLPRKFLVGLKFKTITILYEKYVKIVWQCVKTPIQLMHTYLSLRRNAPWIGTTEFTHCELH